MKTKKRLKKATIASLMSLGLLTSTGVIMPLTSCSLFSNWDWHTASKGSTEINYCLLIGQNDHSDSIERTRYTRKALGTLDETEETRVRTKDNPNIANPINGRKIIVKEVEHPTTHAKRDFEVTVNEIEHMEQKSMAGATWDSITANNTASTWIAKHGNKITFFVSNNDGMAEGAYWASNWIKGMPIFGYDANSTTLEWIKSGEITGTVDQNASTQAASAMMMMRNMLEDRDDFWANGSRAENGNYGTTAYNPGWRGFCATQEEYEAAKSKHIHGWVNNTLISKNSEWDKETTSSFKSKRDCLAASTPIDKDNISTYIKPDGSAKKPSDMFDEFTSISKTRPSSSYSICQTFASKSEAYLIATLRPYFQEYASRLNLSIDEVMGDGTDEAVIINQFIARPDNKFDGYMINMVKTTATSAYITSIAQKAYNCEKDKYHRTRPAFSANGWENWDDRLDTPVIFWNRQPHNDQGAIDREIVNNKFFKYVYFVGVDAAFGGEVQGNLIVNNIKKWIAADWGSGKIQ